MQGFLSKFQSVRLLSLCSTVFYQTSFQTVFNILQACVCHLNLKQCPSYVCFSLLKGNPSRGMKCRRPHLWREALEKCKFFSKQSQPLQKPRQRCRKRNNQCSCFEQHPLLLRHLEAFCTLWQFSYSPVGGDLLVHSRLALLKGRVAVQFTFALRVSNILPIEQQKRGAEKRRKRRRGGRKGRDKEGKEKEKK